MTDLRTDMIWWIKRSMPAEVHPTIESMRMSQLEAAIENTYDGGMARFQAVYGDVRASTPDDALDPQIALRRRLRGVLGRPFVIAACHEIIRVDTTPDRILLVIRVIHEEQRATRIIERGASIRLVVFDADTKRMLPDEGLELTDLDWIGETYVNSYMHVMDPDRFADRFWQWYECYRPGTETYPLDGYAARENLHSEYRQFQEALA